MNFLPRTSHPSSWLFHFTSIGLPDQQTRARQPEIIIPKNRSATSIAQTMRGTQPHVLRLLVAILAAVGLMLFFDPLGLGLASSSAIGNFYPTDNRAGGWFMSSTITHIVLFKFKADAGADRIHTISNRLLGLKEQCVTMTQQPYIRKISGGRDNSPEGLQGGLTHAFVLEFESAAERDYYVNLDPVHQSFKKDIEPFVEKVTVVDFTNGAF